MTVTPLDRSNPFRAGRARLPTELPRLRPTGTIDRPVALTTTGPVELQIKQPIPVPTEWCPMALLTERFAFAL